jgi:hypothetical protein
MDVLALAVAALSLIISMAAYFRSGAKQPMGAAERALNQKLERIGALAQHAADEIAANIRAGYQRSQREIAELQSRLATLREETIAEIREDVGKLTATLERLHERATSELQEIKAEANFKMAELQAGLRLSVEDAKAHFTMIEAKRDLVLARLAILRNDLVEAEIWVESAAKKIDEARSLALGHHENLDALQKKTQAMLAAIRAQADTMKTSIDALIERSQRLLNELGDARCHSEAAA